MQTQIILSDEQVVYTRHTYSILDALCEMGGLLFIILHAIAILIGPWVEFKFVIHALEKLYTVRTNKEENRF